MREIKDYLTERYSEIENLRKRQQDEGDKVGVLVNKNRAQLIAEIYNRIFNEEING
jgi:hypothetical protein